MVDLCYFVPQSADRYIITNLIQIKCKLDVVVNCIAQNDVAIQSINNVAEENKCQRNEITRLTSENKRVKIDTNKNVNILRMQLKSTKAALAESNEKVQSIDAELSSSKGRLSKIQLLQEHAGSLQCKLLKLVAVGKVTKSPSTILVCALEGITWRLTDATIIIGANGKFVHTNGNIHYQLTWHQAANLGVIKNWTCITKWAKLVNIGCRWHSGNGSIMNSADDISQWMKTRKVDTKLQK